MSGDDDNNDCSGRYDSRDDGGGGGRSEMAVVAIVPRMMVAAMTLVMAMMVVEAVAFVAALGLGQPNITCNFNLNKMNLYGLVSCTKPSVLLRCNITNFLLISPMQGTKGVWFKQICSGQVGYT